MHRRNGFHGSITGIATFLLVLIFRTGAKWWHLSLVIIAVALAGIFVPEHPMLAFAVGAIGRSIATLTEKGEAGDWELPILQGLIGSGTGNDPALALFLSGPALSLPNMLVIIKRPGMEKTITSVLLFIVMSSICGPLSGMFF